MRLNIVSSYYFHNLDSCVKIFWEARKIYSKDPLHGQQLKMYKRHERQSTYWALEDGPWSSGDTK